MYVRGCQKFGIKVYWRLQFLGYLRTLNLKFQKALTKIEVVLTLPCWLSQFSLEMQGVKYALSTRLCYFLWFFYPGDEKMSTPEIDPIGNFITIKKTNKYLRFEPPGWCACVEPLMSSNRHNDQRNHLNIYSIVPKRSLHNYLWKKECILSIQININKILLPWEQKSTFISI